MDADGTSRGEEKRAMAAVWQLRLVVVTVADQSGLVSDFNGYNL